MGQKAPAEVHGAHLVWPTHRQCTLVAHLPPPDDCAWAGAGPESPGVTSPRLELGEGWGLQRGPQNRRPIPPLGSGHGTQLLCGTPATGRAGYWARVEALTGSG